MPCTRDNFSNFRGNSWRFDFCRGVNVNALNLRIRRKTSNSPHFVVCSGSSCHLRWAVHYPLVLLSCLYRECCLLILLWKRRPFRKNQFFSRPFLQGPPECWNSLLWKPFGCDYFVAHGICGFLIVSLPASSLSKCAQSWVVSAMAYFIVLPCILTPWHVQRVSFPWALVSDTSIRSPEKHPKWLHENWIVDKLGVAMRTSYTLMNLFGNI